MKIEINEEENSLLQYALIEIMSTNNTIKDLHKKQKSQKGVDRCERFDKKGLALLAKLQGIDYDSRPNKEDCSSDRFSCFLGNKFGFEASEPSTALRKFNEFLEEEVGETLNFSDPKKVKGSYYKGSYSSSCSLNGKSKDVRIDFYTIYGGRTFGEVTILE